MRACTINGLKIHAPFTRDQLLEEAVRSNKMLVAINAEKILNADENFKAIVNNNLGYPDGVGAVWALRQKGAIHAFKIPGCELWLDLVKRYHLNSSFYLIGGSQKVIDATVIKLKFDYPGIDIKGWRNGFFHCTNEKSELIHTISKIKPNFVLVAMGSPRQEELMARLVAAHPAVYQGLGGSFDVYVGETKRSPDFLSRNSLEWLYRLVLDPRRIFRQMSLIIFAFRLLLRQL